MIDLWKWKQRVVELFAIVSTSLVQIVCAVVIPEPRVSNHLGSTNSLIRSWPCSLSQPVGAVLTLGFEFFFLWSFYICFHNCVGTFALVTWRPYCPGRPKELCFTTLSLVMETMGMRLSVVKQSFFGPPGQYGRLVTKANSLSSWSLCYLPSTVGYILTYSRRKSRFSQNIIGSASRPCSIERSVRTSMEYRP